MTNQDLHLLGFVFQPKTKDWHHARTGLRLLQQGASWKVFRLDRQGCRILNSLAKKPEKVRDELLCQLRNALETF